MVEYRLLQTLPDWQKYVNEIKEKPKKKRIRNLVPTYFKFYSLYQYDRQLFRQLLNEWLMSDEGKNRTFESLRKKQAEILDICFKKDKDGKKLRDSDEKHIYRYATLHKICGAIYNNLLNKGYIELIDTEFEYKGLIIDSEYNTVEIKDTWTLPVIKRLKLHIYILRGLKNGKTIDELKKR